MLPTEVFLYLCEFLGIQSLYSLMKTCESLSYTTKRALYRAIRERVSSPYTEPLLSADMKRLSVQLMNVELSREDNIRECLPCLLMNRVSLAFGLLPSVDRHVKIQPLVDNIIRTAPERVGSFLFHMMTLGREFTKELNVFEGNSMYLAFVWSEIIRHMKSEAYRVCENTKRTLNSYKALKMTTGSFACNAMSTHLDCNLEKVKIDFNWIKENVPEYRVFFS